MNHDPRPLATRQAPDPEILRGGGEGQETLSGRIHLLFDLREHNSPGGFMVLWFIYGQYMVHIWFIYGSYMVHIWFIYGSYMVNIWFIYG